MRGPAGRRRGGVRGPLLLLAFAAACVLVPGLFWWGTTFASRLDDAELTENLRTDASPRAVQHAIHELSVRFEEGRPGMDRFAPGLVGASRRAEDAVRVAAAWCMQFDARRPEFTERLRELVADDRSELVRRNAALALAKTGDGAALPVLRAMLAPVTVRAPLAARVESVVALESAVREGGMVARLRAADGSELELRSELAGTVAEQPVRAGDDVAAGASVVVLRPEPEHVENAAAALALVGTESDAVALAEIADARSPFAEEVRATARWAAASIRARQPR